MLARRVPVALGDRSARFKALARRRGQTPRRRIWDTSRLFAAHLQKLPGVRARRELAYSACRKTPRAASVVPTNAITRGKWSRPVSRVLSRTIIPLGSPSPATSSGLPGSTGGHPLPLSWPLPYLALLQVGFAVPPNVATGAVRSYRTVSPLPASLLTLRRFVFCCTFRRLTPPRRYLAPRPQEPGLSSTSREKCSDRPADSGAHHNDMEPASQETLAR